MDAFMFKTTIQEQQQPTQSLTQTNTLSLPLQPIQHHQENALLLQTNIQSEESKDTIEGGQTTGNDSAVEQIAAQLKSYLSSSSFIPQ